jgi:UDP-N-acetylmuramate dehydrogenase
MTCFAAVCRTARFCEPQQNGGPFVLTPPAAAAYDDATRQTAPRERTIMTGLADFADIVKRNEPLAPYTYLKVGGPAEWLVQPRSREELAAVVRRCFQDRLPLRVLGGGCNILIRDEGIRGAVLRLSEPAFSQVGVEGRRVRAGTGATVSALISQATRHSLAGLETLVGIAGTVGGALRCNAGDRSGDIGQYVRLVEVMDAEGNVQVRDRDELRFDYRWSNLDDPVLLAAEFELEVDSPDAIVKRMRKAWIQRKSSQPLSFQAAGRIFKNPRGLSAAALIEQAGLAKTKVGGAEVSERDASCVVVHPGATARDVLRLIDLIRSQVKDRFGVELELGITVW